VANSRSVLLTGNGVATASRRRVSEPQVNNTSWMRPCAELRRASISVSPKELASHWALSLSCAAEPTSQIFVSIDRGAEMERGGATLEQVGT
jgi:hypothetical protein